MKQIQIEPIVPHPKLISIDPTKAQSVVASVAVVPIRKEPDDRSEMVNSMLLGETANVFDLIDEMWYKVRTDYDTYQGFVSAYMVQETPAHWQHPFHRVPTPLTLPTSSPLPIIPLGARTQLAENDLDFATFRISKQHIQQETIPEVTTQTVLEATVLEATDSEATALGITNMISVAHSLLGTPYLWGGRTLFGIDCSGLTQTAALLSGIKLPRDAWQQAQCGMTVEAHPDALKKGDLLFFSNNDEGRITHVALYIGAGEYIHASGFVRKNSLLPEKNHFIPKLREQFVAARRLTKNILDF